MFNLKQLKDKIIEWEKAGVDENTPIYYERIHDGYFIHHGWKTTPICTDSTYNITEFGEGIAPFCMYLTEDNDGNKVIFLSAHY